MTQRTLRLWQGKVETIVTVYGQGPPVVYLHGPWGLDADQPFLEALAASHTVYAPLFPGANPGDPDAIHQIDDWLDVVIYHGELLDALELQAAAIAGHSFGGMVACEFAAALPGRVTKLALIDPLGLWRDETPVRNWMIMGPEELAKALFASPRSSQATAFFPTPAEPARLASFIWTQACTGKFVWPIPDKGLRKRIHRVRAPALVIWGETDRLAAPAYAAELSRGLIDARTELVADAGHLPQVEHPSKVARLVSSFLNG
ncbi:MAG: alpha/beta hydrolase [Chloroflexi bacterium]|nr:alpha/beta hydrolase [Chloroflexota bacterium]